MMRSDCRRHVLSAESSPGSAHPLQSRVRTIPLRHELLQQAGEVVVLNHRGPSQAAFLDAGRRVVDLSQLVVAVWDGLNARGKGGTADVVRYARKRGKEVVFAWPAGIIRFKKTRSVRRQQKL